MKNELAKLIKQAVKTEFGQDLEPNVDYAPEGKGDFASNVAFQVAGGKKPAEIAAKLAAAIEDPAIEKVIAEGPYLNFWLASSIWQDELSSLGLDYGHSNAGNRQKVQVEFISANPTGPLTIGNARGGFIGDVLSNVLKTQGYAVTREYYFNDAGTQVMKLVDSARIAAGLANPAAAGDPEYKGKYVNELASEFRDELNRSDMEVAQVLTSAISARYIEPAVKNMGIEMDEWFNERDLIKDYEKLERDLRQKGLVAERDGALWTAEEEPDTGRQRVLRKSNGDISYLGTDIAYHQNIFQKRGFSRAIKVLGADHSGQVKSLQQFVTQLIPEAKLEFLVYQFVRLVKDGKEVKMGKRTGTYVTTDELIGEVGADVARFFFLMRSADSHMDFDLGLAKQQTQKNPFWYVMYSYVRLKSILDKAKSQGLVASDECEVLSVEEREMVRQISKWPELLTEIADSFDVHKLTFFGQELAKLVHDYYEGTRIIGLPDKEARQKLYFVQQISSFLENYFSVMGIKPISKM